jgi:predicted SprT family Zn-dependent metalloprotease
MHVTEARIKTKRLLDEHGLTEEGWTVEFMNGKWLLGQCRYKDRTIRLSRWLCRLGTDAEVLDTILHEIAHAITGPGHNHNHVWKLNAVRLGANPRAYRYNMSYNVPHKYEIVCSWCGQVVHKRHRKMNLARLARVWHVACGQDSQGQLEQHQVSW